MKTTIQSIAAGLGLFAVMMSLAIGVCGCEAAMDADVWNDGICNCGGEFEFSNATHCKNGGNYYYYNCNNCGYVIETNHQQTKSNKTYEVAAIVDEFNAESGCSVLVDWDGEAWFFEGELEAGQIVIVVFNDCGTSNIYDDEIIEIRG